MEKISERYYYDKDGQLWYEWGVKRPWGKKYRVRSEKAKCTLCKKEFFRQRGRKNKTGKYYCSKSCAATDGSGWANKKGAKHYAWKGGRNVTKRGYVHVYKPEHPNARQRKRYVLEHRLVMEKYLGRFLEPTECVHHRNGIKDDNRLSNLEIVKQPHLGDVKCPFCKKHFKIK